MSSGKPTRRDNHYEPLESFPTEMLASAFADTAISMSLRLSTPDQPKNLLRPTSDSGLAQIVAVLAIRHGKRETCLLLVQFFRAV